MEQRGHVCVLFLMQSPTVLLLEGKGGGQMAGPNPHFAGEISDVHPTPWAS